MKKKLISLNPDTYEQLSELKDGKTFNEVVNQLLNNAKVREKTVKVLDLPEVADEGV